MRLAARLIAQMNRIVVGVAWFRCDEWPQLLSLAADSECLERTHDEWLATAEQTFERLKATGVELIKVDVSVSELLEWCQKNNRPQDAAARATFAGEKLQGEEPEGRPLAE